jgi:hypothetical protein
MAATAKDDLGNVASALEEWRFATAEQTQDRLEGDPEMLSA